MKSCPVIVPVHSLWNPTIDSAVPWAQLQADFVHSEVSIKNDYLLSGLINFQGQSNTQYIPLMYLSGPP
jgi:hypothetical protein